MKGLSTWRNPKNKFFVARLHYSADPRKDEEWVIQTKAGEISRSAWQREREIDFESFAGMPVYDMFDRNIHVRPLSYNPELRMIRGWDFGFRRPACIWAQVDSDDRLLILKMMLGENIVINDFGEKVLKVSNQYFPNAKWRDYGDPQGNQSSDKSELSSIEMLAGIGITVVTKGTRIREGLQIVRWHLKVRKDDRPGLLINDIDNTRHLIDGFEGAYRLKEDKEGVTEEEVPEKDGFYEHFFDALRYIAVNALRSYSRKPIVKKRKKTYVDRIYDKLMMTKKRRIC